MEFRSLVLGLFFSVGIFALKGGLGLHYLRLRYRQGNHFLPVLALYLVLYALLFAGAAVLNQRIHLTAYFPVLQDLTKRGMEIHLGLAVLMLVWGLGLLKNSRVTTGGSRGWWLLVAPCPLCLLVISFSVALLQAVFPESSRRAVVLLASGFVGMSLLMLALLGCRRRPSEQPPEALLASAMIGIAAYFCLTVVIAPQFAEIEEVYRLGSYSNHNLTEAVPGSWALTLVLGALLGSGYFFQRWTSRRETSWN